MELVLRTMSDNTRAIQELLPAMIARLAARGDCSCRQAAANAIVTDPALIPYQTRRRLALLYGKYWKKS
jgi:5'-methylthioadenosine phosphorylase